MSAIRAGAKFAIIGRAASKKGDGQPWTLITVKDGSSGFYSIKVTK